MSLPPTGLAAPAFHEVVFRHPGEDRVVLNVGGMANITILPADPSDPVTGFDTGPGNVLLDGWYRAHHQDLGFDRDGAWSASGTVDGDLFDRLRAEEYFGVKPPKSTGRELFDLPWLHRHLDVPGSGGSPTPESIQATLCELTAATVAEAILEHAPATRKALVCGGGAHNRDLLSRLQTRLRPVMVETTDSVNVSPDYVEALAFAWLAQRTLDGKTGNLPSVTGARHRVVLGGIYPAGSRSF